MDEELVYRTLVCPNKNTPWNSCKIIISRVRLILSGCAPLSQPYDKKKQYGKITIHLSKLQYVLDSAHGWLTQSFYCRVYSLRVWVAFVKFYRQKNEVRTSHNNKKYHTVKHTETILVAQVENNKRIIQHIQNNDDLCESIWANEQIRKKIPKLHLNAHFAIHHPNHPILKHCVAAAACLFLLYSFACLSDCQLLLHICFPSLSLCVIVHFAPILFIAPRSVCSVFSFNVHEIYSNFSTSLSVSLCVCALFCTLLSWICIPFYLCLSVVRTHKFDREQQQQQFFVLSHLFSCIGELAMFTIFTVCVCVCVLLFIFSPVSPLTSTNN